MNQEKTILMAVGSSGGHIYPAVAVAEKLEDALLTEEKIQASELSTNSLNIHFVHSGSPLGEKIFSSLKYPVHQISIGGLAKGQSISQKIKTLFSIPRAFIQSFLLIKKLKAQVILGTGGAVTGPVLMTGFFMGCKTALWEGNAVMGLANKWLAPFVSCVFTVFPKLAGLSKKKQIVCSYPLREKIHSYNEKLLDESSLTGKQSAKQKGEDKDDPLDKEWENKSRQNDHLNEKPETQIGSRAKTIFKVLILGGSQGSFFLNHIVSQAVEEENWRKDVFIYHQTGETSYDLMKEKYKSLDGIKAFAFSLNIEEYYKQCDLIFSRAGSGAIWEIASFGKPLVLIPLTYSAGGHQLENALELSSQNCIEMIKEKDFNVTAFKEKLVQLKRDEQKRKQLAMSLKTAYQGDGAQKIADWILS